MPNAFLQVLGGFSKGASKAYGELCDLEAKTKLENERLIANSLEKQLETDDSLTPAEQEHIFGQILKIRKMDKKTAQVLINASRYHRQALGELERTSKPTIPSMPVQVDNQFGDFPEEQLTNDMQLPPVPTPPRNARQIKFDEDSPQRRQVSEEKLADAKALAVAQREAARAAATGAIEDKIAIRDKYEGTPYEDDVRQMLGMLPKAAATAQSAWVPGQGTKGSELIAKLKSQNWTDEMINAKGGIDPTGIYNVSVAGDRSTINNFMKKELDTVQRGEVEGSRIKNIWPTDRQGNPVRDGEMYIQVVNRVGGEPIGVMPITLVKSQSTTSGHTYQPDGNGNILEIPTVSTTSTSRVPQGAPTGTSTAAPATPTAAPAGGGLPALPAPPVPAQSGPLPPLGIRGSRVVGRQNITIPRNVSEDYSTFNTDISRARNIISTAPRMRAVLGPVSGRVFDEIYQNLGSYNQTPEFVRFMTDLNALRASQIHTLAGAALAGGEKTLYAGYNPKASDTVEAVITKLQSSLPYWERGKEDLLRSLTTNQRQQLEQGQAGTQPIRYMVGNTPYDIPPNEVAEFLKDFPNAQRK